MSLREKERQQRELSEAKREVARIQGEIDKQEYQDEIAKLHDEFKKALQEKDDEIRRLRQQVSLKESKHPPSQSALHM